MSQFGMISRTKNVFSLQDHEMYIFWEDFLGLSDKDLVLNKITRCLLPAPLLRASQHHTIGTAMCRMWHVVVRLCHDCHDSLVAMWHDVV